jgi:gamma-glutamylcyclotransferase (GGCT)/AIG2-like uncharacterized protein YtfP
MNPDPVNNQSNRPEYLFSYGTLQEDHVQMRLFGRILKSANDRLRHYRVCLIDNTDHMTSGKYPYHRIAVYSEHESDKIDGTVLEVTSDELLVADKYEPDQYKRASVTLESGKEAWIYIKK